MASNENNGSTNEPNGTNTHNGVQSNSRIPDWITQDYFEDIVAKEVEGFEKIIKFTPRGGTVPGENYASIMLRIEIEVKLKDGTIKEVTYMLKTKHGKECVTSDMVDSMGLFTKEIEMYEKYLPAFQKLYAEKGVTITFVPRSLRFTKDPGVETVLLEDLKVKNVRSADRLSGLDMNHTKKALKALSQFHAASAVYFELNGPYSDIYTEGLFKESNLPLLEGFNNSVYPVFEKCCQESYKNGTYYAEKIIKKDVRKYMIHMIKKAQVDYNEFNVLNHGDFWCNNIMFKYDEKNQVEQTYLVDYQMEKYGSPAQDLYYFLFSSVNMDIKLKHFDYFIKYYYDNLVENLLLLDYPKKVPTLIDIHTALLKHSMFAVMTVTGIMGAVLLDPTETATMDNFLGTDGDGNKFKYLIYSNPRYIRAIDDLLPWLDNRGILDDM